MRLHLRFEEVELGLAFLFEYLCRVPFEPEVGHGDTKDEAEDKDCDAGEGIIEIAPDVELFRLGGEPPVVDRDVEISVGYAGADEQGNDRQYIEKEAAFFIQPGKEQGNIAV